MSGRDFFGLADDKRRGWDDNERPNRFPLLENLTLPLIKMISFSVLRQK